MAKAGSCLPIVELLWGPVISEQELLDGKDGLFLEPKQWDMINSVMAPGTSRIWVKGNTGSGKNTGSAIAILIYYICYPDAKVIITRDTFDQAKLKAWGECQKWLERIRWFPDGSETSDGFTSNSQHWIKVINPKTNEGFRGGHSEEGHVLFWFDEASSIPNARYEMADTQADVILSTFNPSAGAGPSRKAFPKGAAANKTQSIKGPFGFVRLITIMGPDCVNVRRKRLKRPLAPPGGITIEGQKFEAGDTIPQELFKKVRRLVPGQTCYDEWMGLCSNSDKDYVRVFAWGFFPKELTETQVIAESWLYVCHTRYDKWHRAWRWAHGEALPGDYRYGRPQIVRVRAIGLLKQACPVTAVGIDPAGSVAGDETVLTFGGDKGVRFQHVERIPSVTGIFRKFKTLCAENDIEKSGISVAVDADGIGLGLANMLEDDGWTVIRCYGGTTEGVNTDLYQNARVQRVCSLGNRLNPNGEFADQHRYMIPSDDLLTEELTVYEKIRIAGGLKLTVTSKRGDSVEVKVGDTIKVIENIERQLGRSPDRWDSFSYMRDADGKKPPNFKRWSAKG